MEAYGEPMINRFANLFSGYKHRFGTFEIPPGQGQGKKTGVAKTHPGPVIPACYGDHLKGKKGLGIIPLLDDNESASFGCIDIDKYPMDFAALERDCKDLPVVITKSKSGGAHIWLFAREPVSARLIQDVLKAWAAELGFGRSEIFPKQIRRLSTEDAGNWINLPFFGDTRKAFFDSKEQSLERFLTHAEGRRMNATTLESFLKQIDEKPLFHDGPPCLATLAAKGLTAGSRNMVLLNVGSYFKKKDPANFLANLLDFNRKHVSEPLPESEIHNSIAKSLQRKTYPYQCNQEPLCSACNRPACLKREFGVGGSAEELEITLNGLTKIATDPPTWYINIDGVRVEFVDVEILISQGKFRTLTAETIHKLFPMVKKSAWEKVVTELFGSIEIVEAPAEASTKGQIGDEVRTFIQQLAQEDSMDQVLVHTVYIEREENRAYFLSSDLMRRIKRNLGNAVSSQKIWAYLKSQPELEVRNEERILPDVGQVKMWSISTKFIYIPSSGVSVSKEISSSQAVPF